MSTHLEQFRAAIAEAGISPPDVIKDDGALHRFSTNGKPADQAGWYVLHDDGHPTGTFGCWRQGLQKKWHATSDAKMTPVEREAHRQLTNLTNAQRNVDLIHRQTEARRTAELLWNRAQPATPDSAYLKRKNVQPYGVREIDSTLLVPLRDVEGALHSLQTIDADGSKRFHSGGRTKGRYHQIGPPSTYLVVCEGYATGASIHEATGLTVCVAFSSNNLLAVAEVLRAKHPNIKLVIASDDDWKTDGNPGLQAAKNAAQSIGGVIAVPDFAGMQRSDKDTDFNDLLRLARAHGNFNALTTTFDAAFSYLPEHVEPPAMSDDALAQEFVELTSDLCWTKGMGWMHDNGKIWVPDDGHRRTQIARVVCRAAASRCKYNPGEAKRLASRRTVEALLALAQTDKSMIVAPDVWDNSPELLNTPLGIVDLRTGKLCPREREFLTQITRVGPVAGSCPLWLKFLDSVFQGDQDLIEFMQRSIGYWFTGDRRHQVIHFLYGMGANGKSVLTDLVQSIAGSYALKLPARALMRSHNDRHPTELAQLRGKRLAVSSELDESSYFDEALIKELTGDETLSARFMRGDFFQFQMTQKHCIVGNCKPRFRGGDYAMARRILLIPFNARFEGSQRDPFILEKLKFEAPAILAWIIEGARKCLADGLTVPLVVRNASAEYMEEQDDLRQWMEECCEMNGEAPAKELFESFRGWKEARGEPVPSQTSWGSQFAALPGITKRKSSGILYGGIRLNKQSIELNQR